MPFIALSYVLVNRRVTRLLHGWIHASARGRNANSSLILLAWLSMAVVGLLPVIEPYRVSLPEILATPLDRSLAGY